MMIGPSIEVGKEYQMFVFELVPGPKVSWKLLKRSQKSQSK